MLGGDDHGIHPDGTVFLVILHGDLALAIGPHIGQQAGLADNGHLSAQLLGQGQGQGHQLRRFVAGVAEHHALVAGTLAQLGLRAGLVFQGLVHAHGDIRGLLVDRGNDGAGVAVKAVLAAVVANIPDHSPGNMGNIHIAVGGDLTHDMDEAGAGRGLAGHAAHGVLFQDGVQHGVGDLVADLVGMAFGHGFRSKQIVSCHNAFSLSPLQEHKRKSRAFRQRNARKISFPCSSSVALRRNWHLVITGCRGFIGPVPPPLLIRGY